MGAMAFPLAPLRCDEKGIAGWFILLDQIEGATRHVAAVDAATGNLSPSRRTSRVCSWQEGVDATVIASLSPAERAWQQAIHEFIETEQAYVADIMRTLRVYSWDTCREHLDAEEHGRMVGVLHDLRDVATQLLQRLLARRSDDGVTSRVGDIMANFLQVMDPIYGSYCEENLSVTMEINEKAAVSPGFAAILARGKALCDHMDIHSFRLKPLQRITKYPLLLAEIERNTPPQHPDKLHVQRALSLSRSTVARINQHVKMAELQEELAGLQCALVQASQLPPLQLSGAGISLVDRFEFRVRVRSRQRKRAQVSGQRGGARERGGVVEQPRLWRFFPSDIL
jgi:hypothetical protein